MNTRVKGSLILDVQMRMETRNCPGADIFDQVGIIGNEQIAYVLHLIGFRQMYSEHMVPSSRLFLVGVATEDVIG